MPLPKTSAALCAVALLTSGTAHADPPEAAPRSVFRIDVSLTGAEEGARAAPATYTLILLENQSGALATGTNIPLAVNVPAGGTVARQDVGLSLHFSYTLRGAVVLLAGNVELSSAEAGAGGGPATIHRVRIDGVAPVTPGRPALFGSVFDLVSHRRYEVMVSAQRLL